MDRPTREDVEGKYKGYLTPVEMLDQYRVELENYCDCLEEALKESASSVGKFSKELQQYQEALSKACRVLESNGYLYLTEGKLNFHQTSMYDWEAWALKEDDNG